MAESAQSLKVGDDLHVTVVDIAELREQDQNAQVMQPRHFDRLTENIRDRGQVEQLPYCAQPGGDGPIEIISGHHRVRAARAAGQETVPVLLDTKPMRRSEVIAKQIAHNELHGNPDEEVLRQLVGIIDNVDDLLTTGLPEDKLPGVGDDDTSLALPHVDFDWRLVTLLFLPQQMDDFTAALDAIDKHSEIIGVADRDQFQAFAEAVYRYGRLRNIRSLATSVGVLSDIARREIETMNADGVEAGTDWTRTADLVGPSIPPDAAQVVGQALDRLTRNGDINPDHPWQALERLAADYLAGD